MSESKAKKIEIKDVDGQTLSKLIDYIYTAEIEVTEENVQVNSGPARSSVSLRDAQGPSGPARSSAWLRDAQGPPFYIIILFNPHNSVARQGTSVPKRLGDWPWVLRLEPVPLQLLPA